MMKLPLALAIAISTITVSVQADAQQNRREYRRMNWSENLPEAVRTYHDKRFTVVSYRIADFSETGRHPPQGSEKDVEAIRAAARANKWLVGKLKTKKLTPNDIQWVTRARNGNLTFYVE